MRTSPIDSSATVPVRAAAVVAKPVLIVGVVTALATLFWTGVAPWSAERGALVPLLVLGFLAALTVWAGARIEGVDGFVALYLVWISALTMPHLLVVAWMDRARARRSAFSSEGLA